LAFVFGVQELSGDNKVPATAMEEVLRKVFRFMVWSIVVEKGVWTDILYEDKKNLRESIFSTKINPITII
jgi:hypothetical protein